MTFLQHIDGFAWCVVTVALLRTPYPMLALVPLGITAYCFARNMLFIIKEQADNGRE
jgi:hypothetical protein